MGCELNMTTTWVNKSFRVQSCDQRSVLIAVCSPWREALAKLFCHLQFIAYGMGALAYTGNATLVNAMSVVTWPTCVIDAQGWKIGLSWYFRKYQNIENIKKILYFWYIGYFRYFREHKNFKYVTTNYTLMRYLMSWRRLASINVVALRQTRLVPGSSGPDGWPSVDG